MVSLASATHDIAADGLYIASLSARQQAAYAGWQGAFFNGAKFLSLGGLVILAGHLEQRIGAAPAWATVFGLLGALLAGSGCTTGGRCPAPPTPATVAGQRSARARGRHRWSTWCAPSSPSPASGWRILFILLFRAGEGQIQTIGPLFLRDARAIGGLGLSTQRSGRRSTAPPAPLAFLAGSIGGGYFTSRLGLQPRDARG